MKNPRKYPSRKKKSIVPKKSNAQAIILAGLNIIQVLEDYAPQYLQSVLYYGPDSFIGKNYACVLVWHRQKGYQNYRELCLSGVWAIQADDKIDIIIGSKVLLFKASVYNAESYHALIKQTFKPYYGDDTSPLGESAIVYRTQFDITRRLALRRELAEEVQNWLKNVAK